MLDVLILLGPNSSAADLGAITQPMQAANEISGEPVIDWNYETITDVLPVLTCGIKLGPLRKMRDVYRKTLIFLTGSGFSNEEYFAVANYVRRHYRKGNRFVLLGDAVFALARAGLLNKIEVAVHWESINQFKNLFPDIVALDQIYSIGEKFSVSTCSDATTDLVISLIENELSSAIAQQVQQRLNKPVIREPEAPQNIPLAQRYRTRNPTFISIIDYILNNFDKDINLINLCKKFGLSRRQLERLFADQTGISPKKFLMDVRLSNAARLLQSTSLSVSDISIMCGFSSNEAFRSSFKRKHSVTPTQYLRPITHREKFIASASNSPEHWSVLKKNMK